MKHTIRFSLFLTLLMMLFALPGVCDDEPTPTPTATPIPIPSVVLNPDPEDRLNLRTEPKTSSATQGKFYTGVEVDVIYLDDDWARISIGDGVMEGFMLAEYLMFNARERHVTSAIPQVIITHPSGKKIYDRRKNGAALLGQLNPGTEVSVLAVTPDNWLLIQTIDGGYAFMKNGGTVPTLSFSVPGTDNAYYDVGHYASVTAPTTLFANESRKKKHTELEIGDLVTVLRFGPEMTLVTAGSKEGYVDSTHLNFDCGTWNIPLLDPGAVIDTPMQEKVHLRTQPDANSASLGLYYSGTQVVLDGILANEWVPVSIGNLSGYIQSRYLVEGGTEKADRVQSAMPIVCVTTPAGKLNLREHASTSSRTLDAYSDGTLVTILGMTNEWAHVMVDGQTGFMLRRYLDNPPY